MPHVVIYAAAWRRNGNYDEKNTYFFNQSLQTPDLAGKGRGLLPLYPHLLSIRLGGYREIRRSQGKLSCGAQDFKMSSFS